MPPLMTCSAQKRCRPTISLVSEQVPRCPMVLLCAFLAANFTHKRQSHRMHLMYRNPRRLNGFSFCEVLGSPSATKAYKWVFRFAPSIDIEANLPAKTAAVFAIVIRIIQLIFP